MDKKTLGKLGENIAIRHLEIQGYKIIKRNFTSRLGEIDIIALDKKTIVFVEVKTRQNLKYGNAIEAVSYYKRLHMYKTARYFLHLCNMDNANTRFDAIEVYIIGNNTKINHIKQIDIL